MDKTIKNILDRYCPKSDKLKALESLQQDIIFAKGVLEGKFRRCPHCDDYYLVKSFQVTSRNEDVQVCTYEDPINSGGNEYSVQKMHRKYSICPKGHEFLDGDELC